MYTKQTPFLIFVSELGCGEMSETKHVVLLGKCFTDMGSIPIASTKIKDFFMKKTTIFLSIFCIFFCHFLAAEFNVHSTFILNNKPEHWSFGDNIIRENPQRSFKECKEKWQKKFDQTWSKIAGDIAREFQITPDLFTSLLFQKAHTSFYAAQVPPKNPRDKESPVVACISNLLSQYTLAQAKVLLDSTIDYTFLMRGVGSAYLIKCNSDFYNKNHIDYLLNNSLTSTICFEPRERAGISRPIDLKILMPLILAVAAAQMNHNSVFYNAVVRDFQINQNHLSEKLQTRYETFALLLCQLEAVFQSTNPLAAAHYFHDSVRQNALFEDEKLNFWQSVAADIEQCYHPEDLHNYKNHIQNYMDRHQLQ